MTYYYIIAINYEHWCKLHKLTLLRLCNLTGLTHSAPKQNTKKTCLLLLLLPNLQMLEQLIYVTSKWCNAIRASLTLELYWATINNNNNNSNNNKLLLLLLLLLHYYYQYLHPSKLTPVLCWVHTFSSPMLLINDRFCWVSIVENAKKNFLYQAWHKKRTIDHRTYWLVQHLPVWTN